MAPPASNSFNRMSKQTTKAYQGLDVDEWLNDDLALNECPGSAGKGRTPGKHASSTVDEYGHYCYEEPHEEKQQEVEDHSQNAMGSTVNESRSRSGATHPAPRMPPRVKSFVCPPIYQAAVSFRDCHLEDVNEDPCPPEEEICEEESEEICYAPPCSGNPSLRNQYMSQPSNLIFSKPPPDNPPIGVYPGPRPSALKNRLLAEMKSVCTAYDMIKSRRNEIIEMGEAQDLKDSVRCLENDVAQIENVRDALRAVNQSICHELKISTGFASAKLGNGGMMSKQVLAQQRKRVMAVRNERLEEVRAAIDSLLSSDKLTEEAYEAVKLLQKCPEDCAEDQRRAMLALTLDLLKVADDSFCKAIMSIDWILASFCANEAIARNVFKAIDAFIESTDEDNGRLRQLMKLTGSCKKEEAQTMIDNAKDQLIKSLRKSRKCLVQARHAFVSKFQPVPPIKLQKSDYPRGSSRRPTGAPGPRHSSSVFNEAAKCSKREDFNEIIIPTSVKNVKRTGI